MPGDQGAGKGGRLQNGEQNHSEALGDLGARNENEILGMVLVSIRRWHV